ncbi:MAG: hypothetical protein ACOCV4_00100 [Myxococcota bacterium]
MLDALADLEHHALKRDKRFLVRLVLGVLVGALAGAFLYGELTDTQLGNCAAESFQGASEPSGGAEAPAPE